MGGRQLIPYQDDVKFMVVPAAAMTPVPVASTAWANAEIAAGVEGLQVTASAGASALIDMDVSFEQASLTTGLGVTITDITLVVAIGVVPLSSAPSIVISSATYPAAGAAAAAPVVAAQTLGTLSPATWPTATTGAGNVQTLRAPLTTPLQLNSDLQKLVARLTIPLANTGTFTVVDAFVHFTQRLAQ
jgi:hypothetical protein